MVNSKEPQPKLALQGGLEVRAKGRLWVSCGAVGFMVSRERCLGCPLPGCVPCTCCRDSPVAVQTLLQAVVSFLV